MDYNKTVKQKRTKLQKIEGIQELLERRRRFDFPQIPYIGHWSMPDANYRYRQRGLNLFGTLCWRTILKLIAPAALKLIYGAKVVGKSNLRALKKQGAICVCNHFNYLDTLFVRAAVGQYRSYHTMAPWNNKSGLGGHIVRHGGMLPFSSDRTAMKNLLAEMERLLKKGKIINFYAEQVMWANYQKPRPMKDGAFHYAVKFSVPVLPIFCTFRKNKRGHVRALRIHILPAIYPDPALPRAVKIADMKRRAEEAWKNCYESAYGIPLEYLPRI